MQVSFTGFKNVGFEKLVYKNGYSNPEEFDEIDDDNFDNEDIDDDDLNDDDDNDLDDDFSVDVEEQMISVQLTDDEDGNDLTEFKKLLSQTNLKNTLNPLNEDRFTFTISKETVKEEHETIEDYEIYVNNADKELTVMDKNLKILSFIAKLLTRISESPDEKLAPNIDFLYSEEAAKSTIPGTDLREDMGDRYEDEIRWVYNPEMVREGAQEMCDNFQDIMLDYFDIKR